MALADDGSFPPQTIMNKSLGIALLVVGVILLIFGFNASDSLSSSVKETFTGNPTDRSMWFLVGGAALSVLGLVALLRGKGK